MDKIRHSALLFLILILISNVMSGCSGCSKSGLKNPLNKQNNSASPQSSYHDHSNSRNTIKMEKQNGVYMIPVDINGVPIHFIFDTGASLISISSTEAIPASISIGFR